MYSFLNYVTREVVTCLDWISLAEHRKRSIEKGHVWGQLRYVCVNFKRDMDGAVSTVPVGELD